MNMLPGRIVEGGTIPQAVLDVGCNLALPNACAALAGMRVIAGIRPEHFELGKKRPTIVATVDVVEPLGSSTQLSLSAMGQSFIATFNERLSCKAGQMLSLSPRSDYLHLFEADTGKRITVHE
jgi:multiple sugar transport system ATP-binding protein